MANGLGLTEMISRCAEIIPGKSAAGFDLGASSGEIKSTILELKEWSSSSGEALYEAIRSESGWLSYVQESGEEILYFGRGMVELHFSDKGVLYNIFLFDRYVGTLWGGVKIGASLSMAQQQCPLEYDEGDEVHYPVEGGGISGVAFYAEELPLDEAPDQLISGISIHDWSMRN